MTELDWTKETAIMIYVMLAKKPLLSIHSIKVTGAINDYKIKNSQHFKTFEVNNDE